MTTTTSSEDIATDAIRIESSTVDTIALTTLTSLLVRVAPVPAIIGLCIYGGYKYLRSGREG